MALLAISCGGSHPTRIHDPAFVPDGYHAYSSSEMSYGVALPNGWIGTPYHDSSGDSPGERDDLFNPADRNSPVVSISRDNAPEGLTTQAAVEDVLRRIASNHAQATRGEEVFVNGTRSSLILVDFAQPGVYYNTNVTFVTRGNEWSIDLITTADSRADALPMFRLIVESFKSD
jgi:hypothetical protein